MISYEPSMGMHARLSGVTFNIGDEILTSFDWVTFLMFTPHTKIDGFSPGCWLLLFKPDTRKGSVGVFPF